MDARTRSEVARDLALEAHAGQTYPPDPDAPSRVPFAFHLSAVVGNLARFGYGQDSYVVSAGWLHDALEDTKLPPADIAFAVGNDVRAIVELVTDGRGATRAERKADVYRRLTSLDLPLRLRQEAVVVKLADRIANVESSILFTVGRAPYLRIYTAEHSAFRAALQPVTELPWHGAPDDRAAAMWRHLDSLLAK